MSIPSRLMYDFSCWRMTALCLCDSLDCCLKRVLSLVFFNPQQTVMSERTFSQGRHILDPKISAIACASAIRSSKLSAPLLVEDNSPLSILIHAPARVWGKSVQFDLPSDAEKVEKAKTFIFAPSPSFKAIMGASRLDSVYRAYRSNKSLQLNSNQEVMAPLLYLWLQATCGKDAFHHIPEIDSKETTASISYEGVENFGALFNDERANYRYPQRHISDLQKWILCTRYSDGSKEFDSIAQEYYLHKTNDPYENKQILRNLLYRWFTALYRDDIYLDIPKLRNRYYIIEVKFFDIPNFGEIFYEEMYRFRSDKGFVANQAH